MGEPPAMRIPRRDDSAADTRSLEQIGRIAPQPIPAPSIQPFLEPRYPDWLPPLDDETA